MNKNFNIGERLFTLRTNSGLSQEQLALRADITTTYLGQIEHNTKRPTVHVIEKICFVLNISLHEFFDSENFMNRYDPVTDQILMEIQECSPKEKEFILTMCKQIQKLH